MREPLGLIIVLIAFSGCCTDFDNEQELENTIDSNHFVKTEIIKKVHRYKLPILYSSSYSQDTSKIIRYIDSTGIKYIENQKEFEKILRVTDSFGNLPIFNFDQYNLVPISYSQYMQSSGTMTFQVLGKIDHKNKQFELSINRSFVCSTSLKEEEFFFHEWIKIPKIPSNYSLNLVIR